MDALILSCGTGGGHNSAARAICEELERRGHSAVMMNPYELKSDALAARINRMYVRMVQVAPRVFGAAYHIAGLYRHLPVRSPVYFANRLMAATMEDYLRGRHFDVIITPHMFGASILTNLCDAGYALPPTLFIATDYTCSPFTEENICDAYVIPSEDLEDEFARYGIPREKLYALGIPVRHEFSEMVSREEAMERLGLEPGKRYILLSGGGIGAGSIERTLGILYDRYRAEDEVRIVVICGSNERLRRRLQGKYGDNVKVVGLTDQMPLYMRACSMLITKPGGLSTTEAAVVGIPIAHISPIPGCESRNRRYFARRGMSIAVKPGRRQMLAATDMLLDGRISERLAENQRENIKANAAAGICSLAEELIKNA